MTRDMSYRPRRKPERRRKTGVWIIVGLIAVNVAVILYHGDPRNLLPDSLKAKTSQDAAQTAPSDSSPKAGGQGAVAPQGSKPSSAVAPEFSADRFAASYASASIFNASTDADLADLLFDRAWSNVGRRPLFDTPDAAEMFGTNLSSANQPVTWLTLRNNQLPAQALIEAGATPDAAAASLASMAAFIDFRRMRPGDRLKAYFDSYNQLMGLEAARGMLERARTTRTSLGVWQGERVDVRVEMRVAQLSGEVQSSLWDAILSTGETAQLVDTLVNVFAYDIDFFTEVNPGDKFRLLVEKRFVDGQFVDYGNVLAAEYSCGKTPHRAFAHESLDGTVAYYDADGRSMQKQLIKSPLQFGRVTSNFGRRRHPVLGYTRAHNGVDYGVPTGTPVLAVGDGKVLKAGYHGGFGKYVQIQHADGWSSEYAHLSRISVKVGQRIGQKHVVGAVGTTGLSTGPHLHYGLRKNGRYVNPLAQKFTRGDTLLGQERLRFRGSVMKLISDLDHKEVAQEPAVRKQTEG